MSNNHHEVHVDPSDEHNFHLIYNMGTVPQDPYHSYLVTPLSRSASEALLFNPTHTLPSQRVPFYSSAGDIDPDFPMAYNTHGSWPSSVENAVAPPLITEEFLPSLTVNSELDTHQITGGM